MARHGREAAEVAAVNAAVFARLSVGQRQLVVASYSSCFTTYERAHTMAPPWLRSAMRQSEHKP